MDKFISRIAPTPSGFLHAGNACNFILTYVLSRHLGASLWLRIDDIDHLRTKKEFIDDIFKTLKWLGLEYDYGARDSDDFLRNYSCNQQKLFNELQYLREKFFELFYACGCSCKEIDGVYHGKCRYFGLKLQQYKTSLRLRIEPKSLISLAGKIIDIYETFGDVTLWNKNGFCSYQLFSLIDDEQKGVNLIIRGEDLLHSSMLQLFMARLFEFPNFTKTTFIHHPLIYDENGDKLSKSKGANMICRRDNKNRLFQYTAKMIGVKEFWDINTKEELLSCKNELDRYCKQEGAKVE
jgi:glutamyl-tRNA synthetase